MRALVALAVVGAVLGRPREHEDRLHQEELRDLYGPPRPVSLTDRHLEMQGGHHEVAAAGRTIGSRDEGTALHPDEVEDLLGMHGRDEGGHYVEPAPAFGPAGRHIGAGLGVNVGPLGFGYSTGIGNWGVGYNGAVGIGNFQPYGSYNHYSQYYRPLQARILASGSGFNVGPFGAGSSVGLGGGQLGFSGGYGFQGNYAGYGYPQHYQRYWNQGPQQVFHTSQLF